MIWKTLVEWLVFYPAIGVILLLLANFAGERAFKDETPKWQTFLWAVGAGFILSNFHILQQRAGGW